jgi:hypothetical protein
MWNWEPRMILLARTSISLPDCLLESTNSNLLDLDLDQSVAAGRKRRVQDLITESLPSNDRLRRACLTALFWFSDVISYAYVTYTRMCIWYYNGRLFWIHPCGSQELEGNMRTEDDHINLLLSFQNKDWGPLKITSKYPPAALTSYTF